MKMIKYIFASLLAVASMAAHAQVFDVSITPSDGSEVLTKTNATRIEIKPGDASPIHVFSGESDYQGISLTVSHTVRYDFALTPATTIKPGQDGGLPEGTFDANAPMRRTVEAPSFTEPELNGPALVLMREEGDPIIYYAEDATDGTIKLMCNPDGKYMVGLSVVQGTVTAVFYKDAHTPVPDAAVAATCTATGKTEGSHCSVCEEVLVAQTVVPATGSHTFDEAADPTRSECSVCHHGFFRYSSKDSTAVKPRIASNLKNASGNALTIVSNGYVAAEGMCVMEFNAPLVTIGDEAFINCTGFTGNLALPASVTTIGEYAFINCTGFTGNLILPASVTAVGYKAFMNCTGFTGNLVIPASVTTLGEYAFYDCSSLLSIYNYATTPQVFNSSLFAAEMQKRKPLYVPSSSVQSYRNADGWKQFQTIRCIEHGEAVADAAVEPTCGEPGKTVGSHCSVCGEVFEAQTVVLATGNHTFDVAADSTRSECSVCHHGFFRYTSTDNTEVSPYSYNLGDASGNDLTIVSNGYVEAEGKCVMEFNAPLATVGYAAFCDCTGFTGNLVLPASVTTIGDYAFYYCTGITGNLVLPSSVTTIGYAAFFYCTGITGNLVLPSSVTTIGYAAFSYCTGFTGNLVIPASVTTIGEYAFFECSGFTGSLTIPNSVTSIGEGVFCECTSFDGSLTIPNSVTSIGAYAFHECDGFKGSLNIPNSVTSIGDSAFFNCKGFSSVALQSIPQVGEYAFDDVTSNKSLNLSDASYVYTGSNDHFPELSSVTYTRTGIKNQWGTIVVPFDVAASGTGYQLYEVAYINEGNIGLNKLQGTVQAGTPALIQFASGITEITLTGSNSNLDVTGSLQDAGHDGYTLTGTYAKTNLTNTNGYAIANNAFWNIQEIKGSNQVWSAPFRAYFEADNAEASVLRILAGETGVDEIENGKLKMDKACFNLQGQRIAAPRQGLNIVNGVKVMIK